MASDESSDESYSDWVPTTSPATEPPPSTLAWVEAQLGSSVITVEPLHGGLSSAVHRLTLRDEQPVVLRRYTLADWMEREPNIPADEARNLGLLSVLDLGVDVPQLIAADPDGSHCDVPAIVMSHVGGRPVIDPGDTFAWAERLAACLVRLHQHPAMGELPNYRRWDTPGRPLPVWTADAHSWHRAIEEARVDLPDHDAVLLHRDFHPNNIHWNGDGIITGIVDWLSACNGPIAGDLAHCRWNLAILASPAVAEHFTEHYSGLTGYSEELRLFDLTTVLSGPVGAFPTHAWNALGRTDLTSDNVAPKIDAWLRHVLES